MKIQTIASLSVLAFSLVSFFSAREAAAQEPDGVRFRGGIALEAGPMIIPGVGTLGIAGVQSQLGVQINNNFAVYAVPNLDIVFGSVGGINLAAAIMCDYTLNDSLTFGAGPDVGVFAAIGGSSGSVSGAAGALYGARLHFAWNPIVDRETGSVRRRALSVGADVRLLGGGAGGGTTDGETTSGSASTFVIAPMITVGYTAF
jgi:hypothetical protein